MGEMRLTATRLRGGVWEAMLSAPGATALPGIEAEHLGRPVSGVSVSPVPGQDGVFALRIPIPPDAVADGVQTIVIRSAGAAGETLGHVAVIAGTAIEDDLRAEVELLRAELDMLKRAFRRHCVETAR